MIASIEGKIIAKKSDGVVININGLGIHVFTPSFAQQNCEVGDAIFLHTYFYLRENVMALYGFETLEERRFFLLLLDVNGVGPKASLSILSTLSIDAIRSAVLSEEALVFSRVPGIGKKTAEKILLFMKDKIKAEEGFIVNGGSSADAEVLDALTALGYSVVEAQRAIQSIPRGTEDTVEVRLMIALQFFGQ